MEELCQATATAAAAAIRGREDENKTKDSFLGCFCVRESSQGGGDLLTLLTKLDGGQ